MGRRLLADEPVFLAAVVDEIEPLFVEHVGYSLKQILDRGHRDQRRRSGPARHHELQLALTTLLRSYGVEPDAIHRALDGRGGPLPSSPAL